VWIIIPFPLVLHLVGEMWHSAMGSGSRPKTGGRGALPPTIASAREYRYLRSLLRRRAEFDPMAAAGVGKCSHGSWSHRDGRT
jgi:hypothetical protein